MKKIRAGLIWPGVARMYFEQFYLGCLAHGSYMLGSDGEAVVVDPQRDVGIYLQAAAQHNLTIRSIFETHLHADFVSGHGELAARTGAKIYISEKAGATYPHVDVRDGFELHVGKIQIRVLETPGHTPESICLVVTDEEKSQKPWAVLTGDTLFLGDVGRPDLSATHTPAQLAGMLFDNLHGKLLKLPDDVLVYPAHGAGSLCGRKMRSDSNSTIGVERLTNYALQIKNRDEFIQEMTANLPTRPDYFSQDAQINREGAPSLAEQAELQAISAVELKTWLEQAQEPGANRGTIALDVRTFDQFAAGHVPGSVNIALAGQFASWAGIALGLHARPVLIGETDEQIDEARIRLSRIGMEARGYLQGGVSGWRAAGFALATVPQITAQELHGRLATDGTQVLDVRREGEWHAGHIENAVWWPLDNFMHGLPSQGAKPLAVHCKSGYRSAIACSLLLRAGFKNVANVDGGIDAWQQAGFPVQNEIPVAPR